MTQQAHPQNLPQNPLVEATDITAQLKVLLADENDALRTRKIDLVGEKLKDKNRLAVKLERVLKDAKLQQETLRQQTAFSQQTKALQQEMDDFQHLARKNVLLLKSAHQVRHDTLSMIRQALHDTRPQTEVYNKEGGVNKGPNTTNLLDKTV